MLGGSTLLEPERRGWVAAPLFVGLGLGAGGGRVDHRAYLPLYFTFGVERNKQPGVNIV